MTKLDTPTLLTTDQDPKNLSAEEKVSGVLTFIIADLIIFGMLFVGFLVERSHQLTLFTSSAANLNLFLGILNTLILVTSGLFIVFAVKAARVGNSVLTRRWLLLSFLVGAGFGINKIIEYGAKFDQGISMLSTDFYMFYFALTGAHCLHFIGGMVAIVYLWLRARSEPVDGEMFGTIESVGLYWHMVDLLWIFIFPLLYLMR